MSDTGISSEATSFWVLFNLGYDNDNIKKKIVVCSRTAGKSFRGYVIFLNHAKLNLFMRTLNWQNRVNSSSCLSGTKWTVPVKD